MSESMGGIIPECPGDFVGIRTLGEGAWGFLSLVHPAIVRNRVSLKTRDL
jgi:hypothetical protein